MLHKSWWKLLGVALIYATIILAFYINIPEKPIIRQTIRNYFFHPPMWLVMMTNFTISVVYSIKYLGSGNLKFDLIGKEFANTGLLFGVMGLCTGMFWAKYTWGAYWTGDPKLTGAMIGMLIYSAYLVLRGSLQSDYDKRAKISAVYNIFAYALLFPTLFIIPRMTDSLHPGGSGNPVLNPNDVNSKMFKIFWMVAFPAWLLISFWITSLKIRIENLKQKNIFS